MTVRTCYGCGNVVDMIDDGHGNFICPICGHGEAGDDS